MPGVFGFTKNNIEEDKLKNLHKLSVQTQKNLHFQEDFENETFFLSYVGFSFQSQHPYFFESHNIQVWIYGDPLIDNLTGKEAFEKTAAVVVQSFPDFKDIGQIDGLFTILVFDKTAGKLFIIGDRNGLAHLYYGVFNNQLIWGSELRAFHQTKLRLTINKEAIDDFLNLKYHIKDETWFQEIQLLPPAAYLEWDLKNHKLIGIKNYWSHKNLLKSTIYKPEDEIVDDLAKLFEKAVKKRVGKNERVGITLSGGQDSRAIFANIPKRKQNFTAVTRGMKNCGDIQLAKQTTELRKDCHHIIKDMNQENWFDNRLEAINATSGQKNLFDMNAIASLPLHKEFFDINLDGAGGDGIFSGGHLKFEKTEDLKNALKQSYFRNTEFNYENTLGKLFKYYKNTASDQYFYIHQRLRRFIIYGSILGHDYGIITRFPFLDHDLQEYIYQLPENVNIGKLTRKMYLKYFPEYFKKIDSLDFGHRIYANAKLNFMFKAKNRLLEKLGYKKYQRKYHNYPKWLRENNSDLVEKYIMNKSLKIYAFVDAEQLIPQAEDYLKNGHNAELISKVLTMSVFIENYQKYL